MEINCVGFLVFMTCQLPEPAATQGATFCQVAQPITWSATDTRKTKEQIDTHNRVWKKLCQTTPQQGQKK